MENTHVMSARTSIDPAGSNNNNAKGSSSQSKRVAPPPRNQVDADMAMYTAIMGRPPEIDPTAPDMLDAAPAPTASAEMRSARNGGGAWSPIVLSIYLRDIARQGALKLNRPEIAAWIRRQSVVALRRLHESHVRLISVRQKDRAA
jgi:hypothetical protein